jgi:hypothetical protein
LLPKTIKEPHSPWHLWWIRVIFTSVMQAKGRETPLIAPGGAGFEMALGFLAEENKGNR